MTLQYDPTALREAVDRWLTPYGFHSFLAERHEAADIISIKCLWGTHETVYLADFPAVCALDPPWQCMDPLAAWVESSARGILNASWGHA